MKKFKDLWKKVGPGLVTGAADDDPSGIATYSQTGASYGFSFLWFSIFTFPLMSIVQEMCGRLGIVTGRGLADLIRINFSKKILYTITSLLFIANSFNIGADLGAMSEAAKLILPRSSFVFWMFFFTVLSLVLQIFVPYKKYISFIKYLTLTLLSYIFVGLILNINWGVVFYEIISPQFSFSKEKILCAILGTTISPYLFFWQPSQEIEEEIEKGYVTINARSHYANNEIIKNMRFDTWFGMFFSNLVMFFIILVCGAVLFPAGVHNIQTAKEAAEALKPIAGDLSYYLVQECWQYQFWQALVPMP